MVGMYLFPVQDPIVFPKTGVQIQFGYHYSNWNEHNDNIRRQGVELLPELLKVLKENAKC